MRTLIFFIISCLIVFSISNIREYPLHIVVPSATGGGTDIAARILAKELENQFNIKTIIENKPGANGIIGIQSIINDKSNKILILSSSFISDRISNIPTPYNIEDDLQPIAIFMRSPLVLISNTKYKNLQELKDQKNEMLFGSINNKGSSYKAGIEFSNKYNLKTRAIPYSSNTQAILDLMANRLDFYFAPENSIENSELLTIIKSESSEFFFGVLASKHMSINRLNILSSQIQSVVHSDNFKKQSEKLKMTSLCGIDRLLFKRYIYTSIETQKLTSTDYNKCP